MSQLLEFLEGKGVNGRGQSLRVVLAKTTKELESEHDYIQWLFPLREPSMCVAGVPVITDDEVAVVRQNDTMQRNLREALERMTRFFLKNFHWLVPHDHNHLRITRIIHSVRMLLGDDEAMQFYDHIMECVKGSPVSMSSIMYWRRAVGL